MNAWFRTGSVHAYHVPGCKNHNGRRGQGYHATHISSLTAHLGSMYNNWAQQNTSTLRNMSNSDLQWAQVIFKHINVTVSRFYLLILASSLDYVTSLFKLNASAVSL